MIEDIQFHSLAVKINVFVKILLISVGASLGALCRYYLEQIIHTPLAVWIINTSSCFLMGLGVGFLLASSWGVGNKAAFHLLVLYGFAGGYATFAHYIFYCVDYLQKGQMMMSVMYMVTSVAVGLAFMALGLWTGSKI